MRDAEPGESSGAALADALEELDGVSSRRPGAALTPRRQGAASAKSRASKGSRSSSPSPRPRKRIGTPSSRRSATTAPPRAVPSSLVTISPVERHRRGEELALLHRVLAHGAVEHQQRLVRRARQPPRDDARHLAQLLHQAFLGVQPAGGVDDAPCRAPRASAASIASNATAAGSPPAAPDTQGTPSRLGPHLELRDGAGPIGVRGRQQHLSPLALEPTRQLGGGGGLSDAVHADHQHHGRSRRGPRDAPGVVGPGSSAARRSTSAVRADPPRS